MVRKQFRSQESPGHVTFRTCLNLGGFAKRQGTDAYNCVVVINHYRDWGKLVSILGIFNLIELLTL